MLDNLTAFWNNHSETLISLGYKALLAIAILITSTLIAKTIRRTIQNTNARLQKLDATLIPILSAVTGYVVYTIGGVFILDIFGINTASLIALVGAAGLAIGLALKDSILWGASIKNFTRNGKRRMDIIVGIAYSDSIDQGLEALRAIANSEHRLLQDPVPQVMVSSMAESAVNIQLRAWANNDDYWQTYWDLNKQVKEAIEAAGLTIPFPQRSLHMVDTLALLADKARR